MTRNHLIATPGGWREAEEIQVGGRVMLAQPHRLSPLQWEVVLGGLMGDANLSKPVRAEAASARFRMGHGAKQLAYLDWKASLLSNISQSRTTNAKGAGFVDLTPLSELAELHEAVYLGDGHKHLSWEYLKALTPLALALILIEVTDLIRAKGLQERTQ
jgi:recombination protein RecA